MQAVCKHSFQKSALVLEKSLVFVLSSFVLSSVILLAADPFICLQLLVICLCNTHSHSGGVFLPLTRGPWWTSSAVLKMTSMPRKHSHSSLFSPHCPNSWTQPHSRYSSAFTWCHSHGCGKEIIRWGWHLWALACVPCLLPQATPGQRDSSVTLWGALLSHTCKDTSEKVVLPSHSCTFWSYLWAPEWFVCLSRDS